MGKILEAIKNNKGSIKKALVVGVVIVGLNAVAKIIRGTANDEEIDDEDFEEVRAITENSEKDL